MIDWIKKHFSVEAIKKHPLISKCSQYFYYPNMWRFTQQSTARAAAAGLFAAAIPLMPFQMLIATIATISIRGNLPLAIAICWISNPLTVVPIAYFTCYIGYLIIGPQQSNIQQIIQKFLWNLTGPHEYWASLMTWIQPFGKAFLVGLPLVAIGSALIGYLMVIVAWKLSAFFHGRQE